MIPVIPPRTGVAFQLKRCERWKVIDPAGQQSRDLVAFNHEDPRESIFSGRSIHYGSKLFFGLGDRIYSNRSSVLLEIVEDTAGRHDVRLSPCLAEMLRIIFGDETPHRGCFGNQAAAQSNNFACKTIHYQVMHGE